MADRSIKAFPRRGETTQATMDKAHSPIIDPQTIRPIIWVIQHDVDGRGDQSSVEYKVLHG